MKEIWKTIKDYTNYEISNFGNVKNKKRNSLMKLDVDNSGYQYVDLYKNGKRKRFKVHRLVAIAFVTNPDPTNFDIVNHIDGNKLNNIPSNLEWTNHSGNSKHATENGLNRIDNILKHSNSLKRKVLQYDLNGNFIKEFDNISDVCESLGLKRNSGSCITRSINNNKPYRNFKFKFK